LSTGAAISFGQAKGPVLKKPINGDEIFSNTTVPKPLIVNTRQVYYQPNLETAPEPLMLTKQLTQ
jgi:hypothetical protein